MKHRYALLALLMAPSFAFAQTSAEAAYAELDIISPASIAANISNFDYSGFPTPPYAFPDTANADPLNIGGIIGTSVFQYPRPVQGDTLPRGVNATLTGVTAEFALALTAGGDPALGCLSATDSTSDIGNGADLAGKIAMIQRGTCGFYVKARAVEDAGAVGFIVFNPETEARNFAINMGGGTQPNNRQILIPGVFLPWPVAEPIFLELANGNAVTGTIRLDDGGITAGEGRPTAAGAGLFVTGQNPTSTTARLQVRTPAAEAVTVAAYNMLGQRVAVLFEGAVLGQQDVTLTTTGLPAGSYFIRAIGETFTQTQQITVVR